ncbi:MAG: bifunctional ADP-dependent NAD(P)H-hydrate dehydratase/NAD(P)H-hydrate epimerase [Pauljensenia sp.]
MIHAVSPAAVREAERLAVAAAPEDALMVRAARGVADAVERLGGGASTVVALVGGGDNGGDALHAAAMLARTGSDVRAALFSDHPHPRALAEARDAGVDIRAFPLPPRGSEEGGGTHGVRDAAGSALGPGADEGGPDRRGPGPGPGEDSAAGAGGATESATGSGPARGIDEGVPTWLQGDIWIDGLTGTGLSGPLREPLAAVVHDLGDAAQRWGTRIVAVDVPSGSCTADGTLPGAVLRADHTVTMGACKTPLLLPPAAQYAGTLETVDLGIDVGTARRAGGTSRASTHDRVTGGVEGGQHPAGVGGESPATGTESTEDDASTTLEVLRPEDVDVALTLRAPGPFDHKYTRGVVTVAAGSDTYPGAGVLATMGALGAGPGMVRLESAGRTARIVLDRHPGVVTASGRSQAAVVGSGLDADIEPRALAVARRALGRGIPLVLDAGALAFVAALLEDHGSLDRVVLTPHAGEAATLLSHLEDRAVERSEVEAAPLVAARRVVALTGATVVLKGSVTLVVGGDTRVLSVAGDTGWTGVAGSGDVLAGVLASLLAQRRAEEELGGALVDIPLTAASAVWIHAHAARIAARVDAAGHVAVPGMPIQADDLAGAVPVVIGRLLRVAEEERLRRRRDAWDAPDDRDEGVSSGQSPTL